MAAEARRWVEQISGTHSTNVNTVTGSIVIHYDPKVVNSQEILKKLNEAGYFELSEAVTHDQYVYTAAAKMSGMVWNALAVALLEQTLKRSAVSWITALI
jgi:copper chaperone CopZ